MPSVSVKTFLDGHLVPRVLSAFLRSERWVGKYPAKEVTLDGSWCIQSTVSLKQAAQLMLQLNQGCWDVIYECGYYFHPLKQNLYLKITLVITLATRSGARAPYRFYWWLIWKLNLLVVAIIEFYAFQRLFIRTKFLEVVDGLILAETSRLIMLSGRGFKFDPSSATPTDSDSFIESMRVLLMKFDHYRIR